MPTRRRRRRRRPSRLAAASVLVSLLALAAAVASGGSASAAPPSGGGFGVGHDEDHVHGHGPDGLALDRRGRGRGGDAEAPALAPYAVDAYASWSASQWDGRTFTSDQTDIAARAGDPQVHAIYVYPARSVSRFATFAAMFQADARQASALLVSTRGREIRWDLRAGGYLDITVFQSRYRASQLAGGNQFTLVANELAASGKFSNANKKYVAWLDAGSAYCGQGTLYNDPSRAATNASNTQRTTGIVYRPYPTNDPTTGGFCRGRTLLHELGHNLGAVQPAAPNDFDGAHCDDSAEDVMCYTAQAEARLGVEAADTGEAVFDYNSDDYWDPSPAAPLGWWTVNLNRYLCPGDATTC